MFSMCSDGSWGTDAVQWPSEVNTTSSWAAIEMLVRFSQHSGPPDALKQPGALLNRAPFQVAEHTGRTCPAVPRNRRATVEDIDTLPGHDGF